MLIPFRSKAAAEFFMLQDHAQALFALLGKPLTEQGVFTAASIPAVLAQFNAALAAPPQPDTEPVPLAGSLPSGSPERLQSAPAHDEGQLSPAPVALKQRAWPLMDMLTRAAKQGVDVTWGV